MKLFFRMMGYITLAIIVVISALTMLAVPLIGPFLASFYIVENSNNMLKYFDDVEKVGFGVFSWAILQATQILLYYLVGG